MKRKLITKLVFTSIAVVGCLAIVRPANGQKAGLSANGGSVARGRTAPVRSISKTEPMFYRRITRALGFDFADLEETYREARLQNPKLDFPTLLRGQIAVEMKAADTTDFTTHQLLEALATSQNKLATAFQKVFSLTSAEANQLEKTVNAQYKSAERTAFTSQ